MRLGEAAKGFVYVVGLLTIVYLVGTVFLGVGGPAAPVGGGLGDGSEGPQQEGDARIGNPTVSPTLTPTATTLHTPYQLNSTKIEHLVHEYVNERREANGVRTLLEDDNLRAIARGHSRNMATNGYVGHEQPDGTTREDRYREGNYDCERETSEGTVTGGENVAKVWAFAYVETEEGTVYADTEEEVAKLVVRAWMNSQGHRRNMLREYWGREGIGVWLVHGNDETAVYVTQDFC